MILPVIAKGLFGIFSIDVMREESTFFHVTSHANLHFFSLPRTFFFLRRRRNHCCLRLLDRLSIHLFYSQMSFATKIFFRLALFLSLPEGKLINQQSDLDLHLYFGWGQARKHLFQSRGLLDLPVLDLDKKN